jgi:hypothetical protein
MYAFVQSEQVNNGQSCKVKKSGSPPLTNGNGGRWERRENVHRQWGHCRGKKKYTDNGKTLQGRETLIKQWKSCRGEKKYTDNGETLQGRETLINNKAVEKLQG